MSGKQSLAVQLVEAAKAANAPDGSVGPVVCDVINAADVYVECINDFRNNRAEERPALRRAVEARRHLEETVARLREHIEELQLQRVTE